MGKTNSNNFNGTNHFVGYQFRQHPEAYSDFGNHIFEH